MKTSEAPDDVGLRNTIANDPNEGVMERNGVKRNNEGERTRVRKSGAPSDSVATVRNAFLTRNQYTSHTPPT